MNTFQSIFIVCIFCISVVTNGYSYGNDWNEFKVFKTTKAEVEKRLGEPVEVKDDGIYYETTSYRYRFLFATGPCVRPGSVAGGFNVPIGIVLQFDMYPKSTTTIADLKIDLAEFHRVEDPEVLQFSHYYDDSSGIMVTAVKKSDWRKDIVVNIAFRRAERESRRFSCG